MNVLRNTVRRHFGDLMSTRLRSLLSAATCDLYDGPSAVSEDHVEGGYSGYTSALKELETWSRENLTDVYVDIGSGEITDTAPSDNYAGEYRSFDRSEVARIVFGKLISDGGMSP